MEARRDDALNMNGAMTGGWDERAGGWGGLTLRGVSKRFGAVAALDGVDLDVAAGEVHALLGENGAGKSTLLSLLSGLNRPDGGSISVDGGPGALSSPADALRLGIGTVHQHLTLVPTLTVRENLLLGDEGGFRLPGSKERGARSKDEGGVAGVVSGLPMGARVGELGIGVRQRVEIAKALRRGHRALLLDEPTAVLAPAEVDALLGLVRRLASAGRAVVLVTHKLDEALAVCDRITVLRSGRVVMSEVTGGDREALRGRVVGAMFAGGVGESESRRGGETDREDVGKRFIVPSTGGEDGGDVWASVDMTDIGRAASRGHGEMARHAAKGWSAGADAMHHAPTAATRRVLLEVDDVTVRDGQGTVALDGVSVRVMAGEILGVAGVEGNGQRELAEVLAGQRRPASGAIRLDGEDVTALGVAGRLEAGIALLTDERLGEGVVPGASVALNLALKRLRQPPFSAGLRLDRRVVRHRALGLIEEHGIRPADPDRDIATLSGGNIQRALVARELAGSPRVLVASKPTAGLDLRTAERVLRLLRDHARGGAAVVLISNELDELMAMSDRIAVMYRGRVVEVVERTAFDRASIGRVMLTGRTGVGRKEGGEEWLR